MNSLIGVNKMNTDVRYLIMGILILTSILVFILALIALLASSIIKRIDRKKAVDNTALAMNGSGLDSRIQATAMVLADTSTSARADKLFHWFENLSLASLWIISLVLVVLFSAIFI